MDEITRGWDVSILDSKGNIIFEDFDFETEQDAEDAAMSYIKENDIKDYMLDVSQPDW